MMHMIRPFASRREAVAFGSGVVLSLCLFRLSYDAAFICAALVVLLLGLVWKRDRLRGWIPAIAITALWATFSYRQYMGYNQMKITLFDVSVFPFIAWPMGLEWAYMYLVPLFRIRNRLSRWLAMCAFHSVAIVLFEYLGYNVGGIHLDSGRDYPGWPVLNIFHCPWWMQLAYFLIGYAFMAVATLMDGRLAESQPQQAEARSAKEALPASS
jgi:hypothetical protein